MSQEFVLKKCIRNKHSFQANILPSLVTASESVYYVAGSSVLTCTIRFYVFIVAIIVIIVVVVVADIFIFVSGVAGHCHSHAHLLKTLSCTLFIYTFAVCV